MYTHRPIGRAIFDSLHDQGQIGQTHEHVRVFTPHGNFDAYQVDSSINPDGTENLGVGSFRMTPDIARAFGVPAFEQPNHDPTQ